MAEIRADSPSLAALSEFGNSVEKNDNVMAESPLDFRIIGRLSMAELSTFPDVSGVTGM